MKNKILILSYSHLVSDPRVNRQINALQDNFNIEVSGFSPPENTSLKFYPIYKLPSFSLKRKLKRFIQFITHKYDEFYWDPVKKELAYHLIKKKYDVIIANDIHTLPLALFIGNNKAKVYFDAHEYHPLEFENNYKWRLLHKPFIDYLCKTYIPRVNAFSTVSEGIAQEYKKFVGVLPFLLTNASQYHTLKPSQTEKNKIKLIHHGAAIPSRKLELMIDMMELTDGRFTLDLMLTPNSPSYFAKLKARAKNNSRINFIAPVPYPEICLFINSYDIGIFILHPTNFNYKNALPNKFFEFIQGRLAIAIGPTPEMAYFTKKYNIGVVSDDFTATSMASLLNNLTTEQIAEFKENSNKASRVLSAEENIKKILEVISTLVFE